MPVLDDYDATRQIKADPILKAIPVIAVSSFAMKGDEERAPSAGCDHYATKPYSPMLPMQLLRVIRGFSANSWSTMLLTMARLLRLRASRAEVWQWHGSISATFARH